METRTFQASRFVDAHHEVEALDALARSAFYHVVYGGEHQQAFRVGVDFEAYVAEVGALRDFGVGKLVAAFLVFDEADEGFGSVDAAEGFPDVFGFDGLLGESVDGDEYAADHVDGVWRKRDCDWLG